MAIKKEWSIFYRNEQGIERTTFYPRYETQLCQETIWPKILENPRTKSSRLTWISKRSPFSVLTNILIFSFTEEPKKIQVRFLRRETLFRWIAVCNELSSWEKSKYAGEWRRERRRKRLNLYALVHYITYVVYIVSLCSSFRLIWHVLSGDWLTCFWRFSFSLFSLRKMFSFSSFPLVFIFYATFLSFKPLGLKCSCLEHLHRSFLERVLKKTPKKINEKWDKTKEPALN